MDQADWGGTEAEMKESRPLAAEHSPTLVTGYLVWVAHCTISATTSLPSQGLAAVNSPGSAPAVRGPILVIPGYPVWAAHFSVSATNRLPFPGLEAVRGSALTATYSPTLVTTRCLARVWATCRWTLSVTISPGLMHGPGPAPHSQTQGYPV